MTNSIAWAMLHVFQNVCKKFQKLAVLEFMRTGSCTFIEAHPGPQSVE